jgi:hypothetical protein
MLLSGRIEVASNPIITIVGSIQDLTGIATPEQTGNHNVGVSDDLHQEGGEIDERRRFQLRFLLR